LDEIRQIQLARIGQFKWRHFTLARKIHQNRWRLGFAPYLTAEASSAPQTSQLVSEKEEKGRKKRIMEGIGK